MVQKLAKDGKTGVDHGLSYFYQNTKQASLICSLQTSLMRVRRLQFLISLKKKTNAATTFNLFTATDVCHTLAAVAGNYCKSDKLTVWWKQSASGTVTGLLLHTPRYSVHLHSCTPHYVSWVLGSYQQSRDQDGVCC